LLARLLAGLLAGLLLALLALLLLDAFLRLGHLDEIIQVLQDALLDFLGDCAGILVDGEALLGATHAAPIMSRFCFI